MESDDYFYPLPIWKAALRQAQGPLNLDASHLIP
jgi:hypothetical protein